jgi:hypothetical protein
MEIVGEYSPTISIFRVLPPPTVRKYELIQNVYLIVKVRVAISDPTPSFRAGRTPAGGSASQAEGTFGQAGEVGLSFPLERPDFLFFVCIICNNN